MRLAQHFHFGHLQFCSHPSDVLPPIPSYVDCLSPRIADHGFRKETHVLDRRRGGCRNSGAGVQVGDRDHKNNSCLKPDMKGHVTGPGKDGHQKGKPPTPRPIARPGGRPLAKGGGSPGGWDGERGPPRVGKGPAAVTTGIFGVDDHRPNTPFALKGKGKKPDRDGAWVFVPAGTNYLEITAEAAPPPTPHIDVEFEGGKAWYGGGQTLHARANRGATCGDHGRRGTDNADLHAGRGRAGGGGGPAWPPRPAGRLEQLPRSRRLLDPRGAAAPEEGAHRSGGRAMAATDPGHRGNRT